MSHHGPGLTHQARPPRRPRRGGLALLALLAVLVVVGGAVAGLALLVRSLRGEPAWTGEGRGSAVVRVSAGESSSGIGRALASLGVVQDSRAFSDAARADPRSRGIQPGSYRMRLHMGGKEALSLMLDPSTRLSTRITIPEGSTVARTLDLLANGLQVSRVELARVAAAPTGIGLPAAAKGRAEGYLFPATYEVEPGTAAVTVLSGLVARFDRAAESVGLEAGATARGVSQHDIVTIASLVQAESARPEDDPKVARVIYNRLAKKMKLQLDSTVNYALGRSALELSLKDLEVNSPFNTYRIPGLPPGPINSPGEAALKAALAPAAGDWLYFVTTDPAAKITKFTASYQEFLQFKAEFEKSQQ